jgi:hypothetical protein
MTPSSSTERNALQQALIRELALTPEFGVDAQREQRTCRRTSRGP